MNQTQGPSETDEQQSNRTETPGVDRPNLRNYEELRRSVTDRKVAGVAGGLGRHLNIDPTILRVLFVVLVFFGGAGFVLYGAMWLIVPEDGQPEGTVPMNPNTRNAVLIVAGVLAALLLVGDSWGGIGFPWPLFLVGIGVLIYLAFRGKDSRGSMPAAQYNNPGWVGTPAGPGTTYAGAPGTTAPDTTDASGTQPPPPWMPAAQPAPAYQPPRRPKRGPKLFGFTLAMIAVALGSLGLYDVSGGAVLDAAYPALALAVIGVMLVVGAFVGRAGGLIFLGIVASVALAVTSAVGSFDGFRDGEQVSVSPNSASSVRSSYDINSGRVFLDLSDVTDPQSLDGRVINVEAGAGELVVVLPEGIRSDVTADIDGPGQIDLPNHGSGGINTHQDGTFGAGDGTVTINAHLSAGHIDVRNP
jgi:phage shock protein PspC (stress-responsive transcriptional regulator)